jgi:geranylgeranyl diphosphate synthase type II
MTVNDYEKIFEDYITALFDDKHGYSQTLYDAMRYTISDGGKRIRPVLMISFCAMNGGNANDVIPFAAALEMIHTYSLIHDDLPCMDNDSMRHGKPSNHIIFGDDMALLAGDGLLTDAFSTILSHDVIKLVGYEKVTSSAEVLSECAMKMVEGQAIDILSSSKSEMGIEELLEMYKGKTCALISAACRIGTIIGGGSQKSIEMASIYAENIGIAYQITDDILDLTGDESKIGKNVKLDAKNNKINYVSIYGIEESKKKSFEYTQKALAAISTFGKDSFPYNFAIELLKRDH